MKEKGLDKFERSQLRMQAEQLMKAIKTVQKFRAMLSGFVWDDTNREMFQRMDEGCIELIGHFRKEQHKISEVLYQDRDGKTSRSLVCVRLSDIAGTDDVTQKVEDKTKPAG